jgi:hypothetical protein
MIHCPLAYAWKSRLSPGQLRMPAIQSKQLFAAGGLFPPTLGIIRTWFSTSKGKRFAPLEFELLSKSAWLQDTVFLYRFPQEYRPMNCWWDVINEGVFSNRFYTRSGYSDSLVNVFNDQLTKLIGPGIFLRQTDSGMNLVGDRKKFLVAPKVGNVHEILDIPAKREWKNEVELCPAGDCEPFIAKYINRFDGYVNRNALIIRDDSSKIISKMYLSISLTTDKIGRGAYWAVCSQPDSSYGDYIQTSPSVHRNDYKGYFWDKNEVQTRFESGRFSTNQKRYRPGPATCNERHP